VGGVGCQKLQCEKVRCRDVTARSFLNKVQGEFFAHFHVVIVKCQSSMGIARLVCQDELFENKPLDIKENYEHALDFVRHVSRLFRYR
jgi:hypothetical protein